MYTRTFVGTGDVKRDIDFMKSNFSKMFTNISRFKIELLNKPDYLKQYNDVNYREVHIKTKIKTELFDLIKYKLKQNENIYGFRLSNSQWMTTETLSIYHYKDGKEVADAELV